jgi:hypothetical protein
MVLPDSRSESGPLYQGREGTLLPELGHCHRTACPGLSFALLELISKLEYWLKQLGSIQLICI